MRRMARRISFRACAPGVLSNHGRAFLRAGLTAQALRAALAARQCAEVRHRPIQAGKFQGARNQPRGLPQRQPKQRLQRQACLDRRIGTNGRSAPPAGWRGQPRRLRIEPDQQQITLLEGRIVAAPVGRAVGRWSGFACTTGLTPWSPVGNSLRFVQQSPTEVTSSSPRPFGAFMRETIPNEWKTFRDKVSDNFHDITHEKVRLLG